MKKHLVVLAAVAVVLACLSFAVVYSKQLKVDAAVSHDNQVKSLQEQLVSVQAIQKLHDQANEANVKNAGAQIITLQAQKATLCVQIKAARLVQPLCP